MWDVFHFDIILVTKYKYIIGRKVVLPPKFKLCECSKSKANLWSKVGSIFINPLHCLTCANDLFMRCQWLLHHPNPMSKLAHTFFFPLEWAINEHASSSCFFFLSMVVALKVYT